MNQQCIICDIDGTIALRTDRGPHDLTLVVEDAPRKHMRDILSTLTSRFGILYVSGRQEVAREATRYWLRAHKFPIGERLFMRENKDNRQDAIIKQEIYRQYIAPYYEVVAVLDDRNQVVKMWRDLGLLCFQVDDGDF